MSAMVTIEERQLGDDRYIVLILRPGEPIPRTRWGGYATWTEAEAAKRAAEAYLAASPAEQAEIRDRLEPEPQAWVSFLLGPVIDGRRRIEAAREFATEAEAKADAERRLLMFGNAGWGKKTHDFGRGEDIVVDLYGRA